MDCVEGILGLDDESVDLTITSPPYDNLRLYNGKSDFSFKKFKEIAIQLYRITKQGGVVVWVVGDATIKGSESGTSFRQALYFKDIGFRLHDTMIYAKNSPLPANITHKRYASGFEYMFVLTKSTPMKFNPLMEKCKNAGKFNKSGYRNKDGTIRMTKGNVIPPTKITTNIWYYNSNQSTNDRIAYHHPAIFPDKLAEDHILSWSNEGDLVFDPMCGSGTTLKMALKNDRQYLGFEINQEYVEIANKRLNEYDNRGIT